MTTITGQEITEEDYIAELAQGNPSALRVIYEATEHRRDQLGGAGQVLKGLDYIELRGEAIWTFYRDVCGEDIQVFWNEVAQRMVNKLFRMEP